MYVKLRYFKQKNMIFTVIFHAIVLERCCVYGYKKKKKYSSEQLLVFYDYATMFKRKKKIQWLKIWQKAVSAYLYLGY